eukprot:jgi/Picsp_1/5275/NSC_02637-R1_---NA---
MYCPNYSGTPHHTWLSIEQNQKLGGLSLQLILAVCTIIHQNRFVPMSAKKTAPKHPAMM